MSDVNAVDVLLDSMDFPGSVRVGTLRRARARGDDPVSFSFTADWLHAGHSLVLDPSLNLYEGDQYSAEGLFAIFADITPDRWGRTLLQRRENTLARRE